MSHLTISSKDVTPLLDGLAIVGIGDGGSHSWGRAILERDFTVGRTPTLILLEQLDGVVKGVFPDLVCVLAPGSTRGVMSAELKHGTPLTLVGARCQQRLRDALLSGAGSRAFNPSRYGYPALKWQPMEALMEGPR